MTDWNAYANMLACPLCRQPMSMQDKSVRCASGHCFDIARKGYLNMLRKQANDFYSAELFECRSTIFELGFYDAVLREIERMMGIYTSPTKQLAILDAGCGEGFWLHRMAQSGFAPANNAYRIGIDTSKGAITKACGKDPDAAWIVGDLASSPLQPQSIDVILSILSPSNYESFNTLLTPNGVVIKVLPTGDYLKELRDAAGIHPKPDAGEEPRVLQHMRECMDVVEVSTVTDVVAVTTEQAKAWAKMTPMLRRVDHDTLDLSDVNAITVSMMVAVAKARTSKGH